MIMKLHNKLTTVFFGHTRFFSEFRLDTHSGGIISSGAGADGDMQRRDYKIYTKIAELGAPPSRILHLGGGAFVCSDYFAATYPECLVRVVEADDVVIDVIRKHRHGFRKNMEVICRFARDDVNRLRTTRHFDLIFVDITMGNLYWPDADSGSVLFPGMLSSQELSTYTTESFQKIATILRTDGYLVINHIGPITGKGAWLWRSTAAILRTYFAFVRVFPQHPEDAARVQNIVVVAGGRDSVLQSRRSVSRAIDNSRLEDTQKNNLTDAYVGHWYRAPYGTKHHLQDTDITSMRWRVTPYKPKSS